MSDCVWPEIPDKGLRAHEERMEAELIAAAEARGEARILREIVLLDREFEAILNGRLAEQEATDYINGYRHALRHGLDLLRSCWPRAQRAVDEGEPQ